MLNRVRLALVVTGLSGVCTVTGGAHAQIAPAPAPIAPAPKSLPRIAKPPPCPPEPIKVSRIVLDPTPVVRCKASTVTLTVTAQACGAPAGGSYRMRVGETTFAWGDVPALTAGSSVDLKTTYAPGPTDVQPTIIAEVGPAVPHASSGPPPAMTGFGVGFGVGGLMATMAGGTLAGGLSTMPTTTVLAELGQGSLQMKGAGFDLFKQADAVKATKVPTFVEEAKIAFAKKLEALATKSVSVGDRMLTICPRDAGVEARSWIDQMKTQLTETSSRPELATSLNNAKTIVFSPTLGGPGGAIGGLASQGVSSFGGFVGGLR